MEEIPRLDIDDLYETKQKVDINRVQLYNKLVQRIHNKIKITSRQRINNEFCYFIMPEILVGYPNYNFEECLLYVMNCLQEDSFLVKYVHPNLLLISWRHWVPKYVRDEYKKQTGKTIDKYGNEVATKKDKQVSFFNEMKKDPVITSKNNQKKEINTTYKPSGKFIYGNDILSTIQQNM